MKIKLLENGILPTKNKKGDAGFDLYSPVDFSLNWTNKTTQVKLGIAIEINQDEVALVQGRSGLAVKNGITTIGNVIDSGYRGEISVILANFSPNNIMFKKGDRIAQLVIIKLGDQHCEVVKELSSSERGQDGLGSSGN